LTDRDATKAASVATTAAGNEVAAASDTALAVSITRGSSEALAEAYERHAAPVHALAQQLCGVAAAADLVHEVFLELWFSPSSYDPERCSLRTHLLTTCHRKARATLRRQSSKHASRSVDATATGHDTTAPNGADALLDRLPKPERDAIHLAYFAGYDVSEIAAALGETRQTVARRIRAGLATLRADSPPSPEPRAHPRTS
jgi:RNA polymerase sigma factor (sigma-70 family)